jgi:hypothetical protein
MGVAWGYFGCPQVIQVLEHLVIVDIAVGVLAFKSPYQVAIYEVETQEGAAVFTHSVDR